MNTKAKGDGGPLPVDLALQGGGAHGAFTWGVLDRLLEEPRLEIEGISGTSAGAMMLSSSAARPRAAPRVPRPRRAILAARFRRGIAQPLPPHASRRDARPLDARHFADVRHSRSDGAHLLADDLNRHGANPLRDILADCIEFCYRVAKSQVKLFVTATNAHTGRGHIFRNADLTPEVLLASACLPTLFQAIEIDGEAYWDGGYADWIITPLIRDCASNDTILVQVNPVERPGTPRSARDIIDLRQRGLLQCDLAQGAAHDGAAAAGLQPRQQRGRPLGRRCASTASRAPP